MCGFLGVVLLQLRRPPGRAAVLGHHIVAAAAIPLRVAAELKGPRSQTLFEAAGKSQEMKVKCIASCKVNRHTNHAFHLQHIATPCGTT